MYLYTHTLLHIYKFRHPDMVQTGHLSDLKKKVMHSGIYTIILSILFFPNCVKCVSNRFKFKFLIIITNNSLYAKFSIFEFPLTMTP